MDFAGSADYAFLGVLYYDCFVLKPKTFHWTDLYALPAVGALLSVNYNLGHRKLTFLTGL